MEDKPSEMIMKINPSSRTKENIYIQKHKGTDYKSFPALNRNKKSTSYHIENYINRKIPLEKKIEERHKQVYSNNELWKKIWLRNTKKNNEKISKGVFYNHLTPNRDFFGFNYFYKADAMKKRVNKYYSSIIHDNI